MYQNFTNRSLTGEVRLSYATLSEPKASKNGGELKYSAALLIPKTDAATIQDLQSAINAAYEEGVNILIEVLGTIAEQERMTIRQRQREGIDAAKFKGQHLGRPAIQKPANWNELITQWRGGEITAKEAIHQSGLSKSTFYALVTVQK